MTNKTATLTLAVAALLAIFWACPVWAQVSGPCSNCHIMHNSQDNSMVDPDGPNTALLTTDCLGCHSSTSGSEAISSLGAPIVYNTAAPTFGNKYKDGPNQGLAGGNFYFVEHVNDNRGHNIFQDNPDDNLSMPPSTDPISCGVGSCHSNLNVPYAGGAKAYLQGRNACTKCHMHLVSEDISSVFPHSWHHQPQNSGRYAGIYDDPAYGGDVFSWYRFLATPHIAKRHVGVAGYEDPDWELTVSASDHNDYREAPPNPSYAKSYSVSGFCGGCHQGFGQSARDANGQFHKHPAYNVVIPDSGEYADAFGASHAYDPLVPVGQNIGYYYPGDMPPKETVTLGTDKVMCLSCHRAHGSPYPDMLRFEYNDMQAGGGDGDGEGCFKCHTNKDGS